MKVPFPFKNPLPLGILLVVIISFPLFLNLDVLAIRTFDEARNTVNAYEMYRNGNYLISHFDGAPYLWNTKPPLLIWLQVLFMKILGPGELALRLPSALAGLFTCLSIFLFTGRILKDYLFGFI